MKNRNFEIFNSYFCANLNVQRCISFNNLYMTSSSKFLANSVYETISVNNTQIKG